jgi:ribonuclease G
MPTVNHIGVSRRIGDDKERRRLKDLINKHRPEGAGFIVRTASEGVTDEDIIADIHYLTKTWAEIEAKSAKFKPPALLHAELDVTLRVVRDLFTADIDRLVIDSPTEYGRIQDFVHTFMPEMKQSVELHAGHEPLFDKYGIEVEVTRALGRKVWLKSGGYIIIERTEALTAIDVNTGRFVGKRNVGDTILKTNLEAVKEIVYQLRLRNIGGIIILDFIDMERMNDRSKVYNALKEQLKSDRAKTNITKISELGLVEMTRKRTREEIQRVLTDPCPYCEGKGYLKSPQTLIYEIFREVAREARHFKGRTVHVFAHPTVTSIMVDEERNFMEMLEKSLKRRIMIKAQPDYHLEQYEVVEKP